MAKIKLPFSLENPSTSEFAINSDAVGMVNSESLQQAFNNIQSSLTLANTAIQSQDLTSTLAYKQDVISDLEVIRQGAALGATAVQPNDIANQVEWNYSTTRRKHIIFANHDNLLGTSTSGDTYNLAMISKWDVADFGTNKLHLNLNSSDDITVNDDEKIALQSWVSGITDDKVDKIEGSILVPSSKIDSYDIHLTNENVHVTSDDKIAWNAQYTKPANGIPEDDLDATVRNALNKAKNAVVPQTLEAYLKIADFNTQFSSLTNGAPEAMDTFKEVADSISNHYTASENMFAKLLKRIELLESQSTTMKYTDTAEAIANISVEEAINTNLVVTSTKALESMTQNTLFKSIAIVGADTNQTINLNASDNIVLSNGEINGLSGSTHGKINFSTPSMEVKNMTIKGSAYNVFEGTQDTADTSRATNNIILDGIIADNTLSHNVMNIYTPTNNANITIKNSKFDLNVANTNVLRMSNYLNSSGVCITFENVDWTYETIGGSENDFKWAGLVIYQPAGADKAFIGDNSCIDTWVITIKNCRYNGEIVTSNNYGEHNQILYGYNMNQDRTQSDISNHITINFIND